MNIPKLVKKLATPKYSEAVLTKKAEEAARVYRMEYKGSSYNTFMKEDEFVSMRLTSYLTRFINK